jgi:hypothetical protein
MIVVDILPRYPPLRYNVAESSPKTPNQKLDGEIRPDGLSI